MKGKGILRKWLTQPFTGVSLVDKCLLAFFLVLLLQSAYSLFAGSAVSAEAEHIDIIVRTSMAAIFGYFLSANFIRSSDSRETEENRKETDLSVQSMGETEEDFSEKDTDSSTKMQVLIASAIGLFCLLVLLIYRNADVSVSASGGGTSAAAAQLRDFVSGCVGFLIGSPADKKQ